jgi:hypothetical protein
MTKLTPCLNSNKQVHNVKVRVIKAPLVDSETLREILLQRQRALVL